MSDVEGGSLELLQAKHRKEKKELKDQCLAMKKAAKCGNKQKQKETNTAIEQMEKEIEQRHKKEVDELADKMTSSSIAETTATTEEEKVPVEEDNSFYKKSNMTNKAKKRQDKQAAAAERLRAAIAEDRESQLTSLRFTEFSALTKVLEDRGLQLVDIIPDGDCLYHSVAHQLNRSASDLKVGVKDMRRRAARYILEHKDDFIPFLTNDKGEPLDQFEFEKYCGGVENEAKNGGVWGGEPELIALSKSLERKIEVVQPEGRVIVFGEEYSTRPLTIVYQRHAYQLGEHYNSTEPKTLA